MSKITANRVALAAAFITSIAAGIAGVAKTVPGHSGQTILVVAGMIGAVGAALTFVVGTWKFDATPVGQAVHVQKLGVLAAPVSKVAAPATLPATGADIAQLGDRIEAQLSALRTPAAAPVAKDPALTGFGETVGAATPPAS